MVAQRRNILQRQMKEKKEEVEEEEKEEGEEEEGEEEVRIIGMKSNFALGLVLIFLGSAGIRITAKLLSKPY